MRSILAFAAVAAACLASPAIAQTGRGDLQVKVSYADLDLASAAGRTRLDRRIRAAVAYACGPVSDVDPAGKTRVLWVDYATSVALHTIPPGNPKEKRVARMLSPDIADNRITFGCINVPKRFYAQVSPLFAKKGGYVYILPDIKQPEDVFPQLHAYPAAAGAG